MTETNHFSTQATTPSVSKAANRLDLFLALRGIACFMVLLCHAVPEKGMLVILNYDLSWIFFGCGPVAVYIFFCLSGYLMGKAFYTGRYTVNSSGLKNFFRNRILRIFPLYYSLVLIFVSLVYLNLLAPTNWHYLLRILTFTYSQALPVDFSLSFWSLSTEVQFYLIVPFLYLGLKPHLSKLWRVALAFVGIMTLVLIIRLGLTLFLDTSNNYNNYVKYVYSPLLTNVDLFLCGFLINAWLACQRQLPPKNEPKFIVSPMVKKVSTVLLVAILYAAPAFYTCYIGKYESVIYPIFAAVLTSLLIYLFELDEEKRVLRPSKLTFNTLSKNPLRLFEVFGNLSYGVYLWHEAILHKVEDLFVSGAVFEVFMGKVILTLGLSILLATGTYYAVELPAARWKDYRQVSSVASK